MISIRIDHLIYYIFFRNAFDEDRVPDLRADIYLQDIHSISSLLKMYFRELPNPLLTYQLYDKFAVSNVQCKFMKSNVVLSTEIQFRWQHNINVKTRYIDSNT